MAAFEFIPDSRNLPELGPECPTEGAFEGPSEGGTDADERELAACLLVIELGRLYESVGYGSTAEFAEARLGLSRYRTEELLRLGRELVEPGAIGDACSDVASWSEPRVALPALPHPRVDAPERATGWRVRALDIGDLVLPAGRSNSGPSRRTLDGGKASSRARGTSETRSRASSVGDRGAPNVRHVLETAMSSA